MNTNLRRIIAATAALMVLALPVLTSKHMQPSGGGDYPWAGQQL